MDVYGNIRPEEIFQTAGMVGMKMAENDCPDILHIVPSFSNSFVQVLVLFVFDLGKDVICLRLAEALAECMLLMIRSVTHSNHLCRVVC